MPFGQHQDTELWNNQFPETKILGLPASQRMLGLVYMASSDKVDVDTLQKGVQYALERLGKSKFGLESTTVSNFRSKSHEGSGNEIGKIRARKSRDYCDVIVFEKFCFQYVFCPNGKLKSPRFQIPPV